MKKIDKPIPNVLIKWLLIFLYKFISFVSQSIFFNLRLISGLGDHWTVGRSQAGNYLALPTSFYSGRIPKLPIQKNI